MVEKFSFRHLGKEMPLLISAMAALCLFVIPAKVVILLVCAVFCCVLAAVLFGVSKPEPFTCKYRKALAWVIAVYAAIIGFYQFFDSWVHSGVLAMVGGIVGIPVEMVAAAVAVLGCGVGMYALHRLGCWIVVFLVQYLPKTDIGEMKAGFKRNWYFPLSVLAFFLLARVLPKELAEDSYTAVTADYFLGVPAVLLAAVAAATQMEEPKERRKNDGLGLTLVSCLTALGICVARYDWSDGSVLCVVWAVLAGPAVYDCVSALWRYLRKTFRETGLFAGVGKWEKVLYALLLGATLVFMTAVFRNTDAFYDTAYKYDIIFTSDSPILVRENVYMNLTHSQNDLRQPIFAVCAAPFVGWAYLVKQISPVWCVIAMNAAQIVMMFAANFMLCRAMKLEGIYRGLFMALLCCGYPYLLFSLMMEQYMVAYFWLVLAVYLACVKGKASGIAFVGATGSLLTSAVLLPLTSQKHPVKEFQAWFWDMVNHGLEFVAAIVILGRLDVIRNIAAKTDVLGQFTGKELTLMDKLGQYTAFVGSCFTAPAAGVSYEAAESISWQLAPANGLSGLGIGILVLVLVSAVVNREKRSSRIAAAWAVFSFGVLCVLGWGTQENGLILYALYFGWAFALLLFQLVQWIGEKTKAAFLAPAIFGVGIVWLLMNNVPAMMELIRFAVTYYAR